MEKKIDIKYIKGCIHCDNYLSYKCSSCSCNKNVSNYFEQKEREIGDFCKNVK